MESRDLLIVGAVVGNSGRNGLPVRGLRTRHNYPAYARTFITFSRAENIGSTKISVLCRNLGCF